MAKQTDLPGSPSTQPTPLRAVARITIGGVMLGIQTLRKGAQALAASGGQEVINVNPAEPAHRSSEEQLTIISLPSDSDSLQISDGFEPQDDQIAGYVLIGMLLDAGERIGRLEGRINRGSMVIGRRIDRMVSPITGSRLVAPLRKRFDRLVARGDDTVERWRKMGQQETYQGQKMLTSATISTVDTSIDYVTSQPEVVNLVRTSSASFSERVMKYLRGIFVSLDTVIEGKLRSLLNLKPRRQLPPPAKEIRTGAIIRFLDSDHAPIDLEKTRIGDFAGLATRGTALLIDLLILSIGVTFSIWFMNISIEMLGINLNNIFLFMSQEWIDRIGEGLLRVLTRSTFALIAFNLYYTLFWVLFGQSIGAMFMGFRVIQADGSLPGILRSFFRVNIGYSLSLSLLFAGVWLILLDPQRRSLHDRIFRTYVIYTWDARPSERFLVSEVQKYE